MPNFPRELPTIKFGEDVFYIDTRLHEFRQKDAPQNIISFYDMASILDESTLLCYDTKIKNTYRAQDDKIPLPKHVLILRLPPIRLLDPVGLALWGKLNEDTFISKGNNFFPSSITLTDKKIKELYGIEKPIKRVIPRFGMYDTILKEEKLKNENRNKRK